MNKELSAEEVLAKNLDTTLFPKWVHNRIYKAMEAYAAAKQVSSPSLSEYTKMREALEEIIEMNLMQAEHQYGDKNKAEAWGCVRVARHAISQTTHLNQESK